MLTEKTFDTGTVKLNYAEDAPGGNPLGLRRGPGIYGLSPDRHHDFRIY